MLAVSQTIDGLDSQILLFMVNISYRSYCQTAGSKVGPTGLWRTVLLKEHTESNK
jgi:hypothetical protein